MPQAEHRRNQKPQNANKHRPKKKKENPPESAHELKDQERGGLKDKIMRPNAGEDVGTGSLKSWKLLWQLL